MSPPDVVMVSKTKLFTHQGPFQPTLRSTWPQLVPSHAELITYPSPPGERLGGIRSASVEAVSDEYAAL
jgi:hypothetical protein